MEKPEQIGVAVGILVNRQKSDALRWVRDILTSAAEERKAWEDADEARKQLAATVALEDEAAPETDSAEAPSPPSIRKYFPNALLPY